MSEIRRPIGVTILAVMAAIAAVIAFYQTLQFLGILPISLGPLNFFGFNLLGAIFSGLLGIIYLWAAANLWNLRPQGWLFTVALAAISLIFAVVSILGMATLLAELPLIVISGVILLYCLTPGVKDAFNIPDAQADETSPAPQMAGPASSVEEQTAGLQSSVDGKDPGEVRLDPAESAASPALGAGVIAANEMQDQPASPEPASKTEEQASETRQAPASASASSPSTARRVDEIEGIGPTYAAVLADAGIKTTDELLKAGADPAGRKQLAEKTGLSPTHLLKWLNMADLMRVPGIGEEFSELLEVAGVDTVKELRTRNPNNLHKALEEAASMKNIVRRAPNLTEVEAWVTAAKELDPILTY
ncbi:MAG: DUF4332 domain-containing protein [Anaerolineales bacterium]|nr:DUF4332 domain-containing protein [Anaerolineales bacterium]